MYFLCDFLSRSCLLGSSVTYCDVLPMFYFKQNGKDQQKLSCNIVINQQSSLPASDRSAPETKVKDPELEMYRHPFDIFSLAHIDCVFV